MGKVFSCRCPWRLQKERMGISPSPKTSFIQGSCHRFSRDGSKNLIPIRIREGEPDPNQNKVNGRRVRGHLDKAAMNPHLEIRYTDVGEGI